MKQSNSQEQERADISYCEAQAEAEAQRCVQVARGRAQRREF